MSFQIQQAKWINLDMDGVVADWVSHYSRCGVSTTHHLSSQEMWDHFMKAFDGGIGFYRTIPVFDGAKAFFDAVVALAHEKGYKVRFLTALIKLAEVPNVHEEKREWVIEHLGADEAGVEVEVGPLAEHKHLWCNAGDILIDDRRINIRQWVAKGGIGIHHTSFDKSLEELKAVLNVES